MAANYIPKGYELKTEGPYEGKIHNDETGKGITVMPFNAANLDDMKTRDFSNVLNVEKMEIQNMEAHVITYEKMGETLQDILLFNEADGYCVDTVSYTHLDFKHVILSLYKHSRLWLRRSVNAVSPYNL